MKEHEKIRELREANHLSQTQLAQILNVSYPTYRRYEHGERKMTMKVIIDAANYFNVPITDICEDMTVTALGNKGYAMQNIDTTEVIKVTETEFKMLKDVLEAFRKNNH